MKKNILFALFIGLLSSSVFALGTSVPGSLPCKINSAGNTVYQFGGTWMSGQAALAQHNYHTGNNSPSIKCNHNQTSNSNSNSNWRRQKKFMKKSKSDF